MLHKWILCLLFLENERQVFYKYNLYLIDFLYLPSALKSGEKMLNLPVNLARPKSPCLGFTKIIECFRFDLFLVPTYNIPIAILEFLIGNSNEDALSQIGYLCDPQIYILLIFFPSNVFYFYLFLTILFWLCFGTVFQLYFSFSSCVLNVFWECFYCVQGMFYRFPQVVYSVARYALGGFLVYSLSAIW